jgi:hypothetical protein
LARPAHEGDAEKARSLIWRYSSAAHVTTAEAMVTPDGVEEHFRAGGVPDEPDVLSIDVDGIDWWIWTAIASFRPRIVVVECNGHITTDRALTIPSGHRESWDGTAYYGACVRGSRPGQGLSAGPYRAQRQQRALRPGGSL